MKHRLARTISLTILFSISALAHSQDLGFAWKTKYISPKLPSDNAELVWIDSISGGYNAGWVLRNQENHITSYGYGNPQNKKRYSGAQNIYPGILRGAALVERNTYRRANLQRAGAVYVPQPTALSPIRDEYRLLAYTYRQLNH